MSIQSVHFQEMIFLNIFGKNNQIIWIKKSDRSYELWLLDLKTTKLNILAFIP